MIPWIQISCIHDHFHKHYDLYKNLFSGNTLYPRLLAFKVVMGSDRRKALQLKAKMSTTVFMLKCLEELPSCFKVVLEGRFGKILDLLTVKVQIPVITALA